MRHTWESVVPGPGRAVDWAAVTGLLGPLWAELEATPQDPVYHAEGDVAIHTRLVVEALVADDAWQVLPEEVRRVLFLAAVFHDCGKPATTRGEDGRITSRGHSRAGEILARRVLWEAGVDVRVREAVAALVRTHMRPHFFYTKPDPLREAITLSTVVNCAHLALLARADATGRRGPAPDEALAAIDMFEAGCREYGCFHAPFPFPSDHSRFLYFRLPDRNPFHQAHDDTRGTVTVLSGLPAAGKSSWREAHPEAGPAICLDDIRDVLLEEDGPRAMGRAVPRAYEQARQFLRDGASFVWDATNISRDMRRRILSLAADYGARTRIVSVEAAPELIHARNAARHAPVPPQALDRMLARWEFPDLTEAHAVTVAPPP